MPRATTAAWLGHAAAHGEDALGILHALDVLGRGLQTDQDHLLAGLALLHGVLGGEHDLTAGSAGRGSQSGGHGSGLLQGLGVELGDATERPAAWGPASAGPSSSDFMPSSIRSQAILMAAWGVRLPLRVCSM